MQANFAVLSRQGWHVGNGSDYFDSQVFANSSEMGNRVAYITLLYGVAGEQWGKNVLRKTYSSSSLF